jgi:hypothetical protein
MPPSVALVAMGPVDGWMPALPIPLFPFWPLVALGIGVLAVLRWARQGLGYPPGAERARAVLEALCRLRGLKVDLRSRESRRVLIWFV